MLHLYDRGVKLIGGGLFSSYTVDWVFGTRVADSSLWWTLAALFWTAGGIAVWRLSGRRADDKESRPCPSLTH